jgi:hypothetical protein
MSAVVAVVAGVDRGARFSGVVITYDIHLFVIIISYFTSFVGVLGIKSTESRW